MITVIIPCWERQEELRQALYSLAAQTSKDFQVIVSDDHSNNDMKLICDEFDGALSIDYIRTTVNLGCGGNRNFALKHFYGYPTEYVMFLDSDDVLMPHAIARLGIAIEKNNADIILTDIMRETELPVEDIIEAKNSKTWLHGKIYRSQFLIEHNIIFPDIKTNEDLGFNLACYAYEPESYFLSEKLYLWRDHNNSVTRSPSSMTTIQKCRSIDYLDAIYFAFGHYKKDNLSLNMIANIINCYSFWQNATIFGVLHNKAERNMRRMLHHPQVSKTLVSLYVMPETDFQLKQWVVKDDSLVFYGQTFGQWIMKFFTQEEIKQLITENKLRK